ncbi:Ig-like domain-containing protein [Yersinia pekkanenii]|uniref:Ig-like domain-containing protein n=1 Tax=Yersinia pekkanenii TaxID=1288385 RepID=UPI0022874EF1|nr:Ig-like domain-containing protein [Yersinia pekkanenii]
MASVEANGHDTSTVTLALRDSNNNPIPDLAITFTTDRVNSQITNQSHSGNSYTANIDGTKVGIANIAVQLSGTLIAGLMETVTITPGARDQAQEPDILSLGQPIQECALRDGTYRRRIIDVDAMTLYDNYGNETAGVITYDLNAGRAILVT